MPLDIVSIKMRNLQKRFNVSGTYQQLLVTHNYMTMQKYRLLYADENQQLDDEKDYRSWIQLIDNQPIPMTITMYHQLLDMIVEHQIEIRREKHSYERASFDKLATLTQLVANQQYWQLPPTAAPKP